MALKIITPPAVEPVTMAEVKLHLRVDGNDEDPLLTGLIQAAREHVEIVLLHRALVTQTLEYVISSWPCLRGIQLPRPPLASVTTIKYKDATGLVETTWSATQYVVNTDVSPGEIVPAYGCSWPSATLYPSGGIRVRYVAGYGLAAAVPQAIKAAILLLVGHLYENRQLASDKVLTEIPFAVNALCSDPCYMVAED
jgi:uncharacterized phiE125 gp8 family phage protein